MTEPSGGPIPELGPPRGPHLAGLDGLRGVAILMVMASHIFRMNAGAGGTVHSWMQALLSSLWIGVDLFFVLSGFLITGILVDTLASQHFFRNFYMRRVLRVFPLYYAVILVFVICAPMLHIVWGGQLLPLLTYTNRIFIDPHHPGFRFYFGGHNNFVNFWSLAVEEQFYFVWPLLIFCFKRARILIPIAALLTLASMATRIYLVSRHTAPDVIYVSLACRADSLLIGSMLALAVRHGYRSLIVRIAPAAAWVGAAMLVVLFIAFHGIGGSNAFMQQFGYTFNALFFAALVALAIDPANLFTRLCTAAWLRFFGRYSYGLYILHSVLPAFYASRLHALLASMTSNLSVQNAAYAIIEFTIAVVAAVLSYRFFEEPFLRLKKYFPNFTPRPHKNAALAVQ